MLAVLPAAACSSGDGPGSSAASSTSTTSGPPSTGPGSQTQPVPLNASAQVSDKWQVKVVETVPDAAATLREAGQKDAKAPAGRQLFLVTMDITYVGGGSASPQYSLVFKALDSAGEYTGSDDCGVLPDPVPASDVVSGATVRGSVCWAVRPENVDSLVMVADSGFLQTDQIHFALR